MSALTPNEPFKEFQEYFDYSMNKRKGITFYVNSQIIDGVVTKVIPESGGVEIANRTHGRIFIRFDRIDAIAMA